MTAAPVIVHIVHRFDYGGLENGVVNLVSRIPADVFSHVVVALTESTEFSRRLPSDVPVCALNKRPGKDPIAYFRLYRLLRHLSPEVVHTRNIGTLDCLLVAWLARVPVRIHGEHGWDIFDPDGSSLKHRLIRKVFYSFAQAIITVSEELRGWIMQSVGPGSGKISKICNGVDIGRFAPAPAPRHRSAPWPKRFQEPGVIVIGSVTRFSKIKDPLNLVEAFVRLRANPANRMLRLVMVGDGDLLVSAKEALRAADLLDVVWLPGSREDTAEILPSLDIYVLGSLREGISNTILEAMACGLPVVATRTGGTPELVTDSLNGFLVEPGSSSALAAAVERYLQDPELRRQHGRRGRERAEREFSLSRMVDSYLSLYSHLVHPSRF